MPTSFGVAKAFRSGEFRDPAVTYGDFFVFNYDYHHGSDLDIRCKLLIQQVSMRLLDGVGIIQ